VLAVFEGVVFIVVQRDAEMPGDPRAEFSAAAEREQADLALATSHVFADQTASAREVRTLAGRARGRARCRKASPASAATTDAHSTPILA
jgi:hypothetical protein